MRIEVIADDLLLVQENEGKDSSGVEWPAQWAVIFEKLDIIPHRRAYGGEVLSGRETKRSHREFTHLSKVILGLIGRLDELGEELSKKRDFGVGGLNDHFDDVSDVVGSEPRPSGDGGLGLDVPEPKTG